MRCYGVMLPGSDLSRFYYPRPRPTVPNQGPLFPTQVRFRSIRASAGAGVHGGVVAEARLSFYDLLGIPVSGTLPEIKQAYKQMARKYHPDVSPPDRVEEYTQRFIRVQEAYETLSDPRRRALYDGDMAKGLHLAFSARRPYKFDEDLEDKSEWKGRWQSQISELKRRSMVDKQSSRGGGNMSWGARMRRQREDDSSDELL